jgi:hypothetical protein
MTTCAVRLGAGVRGRQVGPCNCITFLATLVSTDTNSPPTTTVALQVTNKCNSGVATISIDYTGLTLVSPPSGNTPDYGSAHLSPVAGAYSITKAGTVLTFTAYNGGPWATTANFQNNAWDVLVFRFQGWTNGYAFPSLSAKLADGRSDTYAGINFAGCPCANCDNGGGSRAVKSCTIPYPTNVAAYPKTSVSFAESETYAASAIVGNELQVFWKDEWSATLGVYQVRSFVESARRFFTRKFFTRGSDIIAGLIWLPCCCRPKSPLARPRRR